MSATELGETEHADISGAPLQVNDTVCAKPPPGATRIVKVAVCPAEIVAVEEPDEAIEKSWPVPLRERLCGLSPALSVTVSVPVRVPVAVGSKKTPIEQLDPTATLLPQVLSGAKSAGAAITLVIASGAAPVLVNVTFCGRPEVPTYWLGKVTLVGDKVTAGPMPDPVRVATWGLAAALSVTLTVALLLPGAAGVNVTLMLQEPPVPTVVPQLLVWENSALLVPVTAIELTIRAALPAFISVRF